MTRSKAYTPELRDEAVVTALTRQPRQFFERVRVEVRAQFAQHAIEFVAAEEPLMAQPCQDPAFNHQHAVLDLGLVLGLARPRRQHRNLVVARQILIVG